MADLPLFETLYSVLIEYRFVFPWEEIIKYTWYICYATSTNSMYIYGLQNKGIWLTDKYYNL